MLEIGAYQAKTHLARLLKQVEAGETVTITRNGRPVARLAPIGDARDAVKRLLALRGAMPSPSPGTSLSMRSLIEEGRR